MSAQEITRARANMYRFLAGMYLRPPAPRLVRQIADEDVVEQMAALLGEGVVVHLRRFASGFDTEGGSEILKSEYMALFAVPAGRYVAPFEDVYGGVEGLDGNGPLLGERAIAVTRMYRAAGAAMECACRELPTHVGVELAFMDFLCARELAAAAEEAADPGTGEDGSVAYRQLQLRFLQEHLNRWFPRLGRTIQAKTRSSLYRGLALITEAFLARDAEQLCRAKERRSAVAAWTSLSAQTDQISSVSR